MSVMIKAQDLWKTYKIYKDPIDRLKESLSLTRKVYHRPFDALKNISFEVQSGQSTGLIGVNGSGKSTLLQLIAGVLTPSQGSIQVNGRVAALLELGTGFNGDFTGRENVKFQCTLMGIPQDEQGAMIEEVEAFADIDDFMDQPVKTYSSGMYVRLAFAAAIHVDPDILIIDEALAVGDIRFQTKCLRKIREFRAKGKTLLFVSHDAGAVKTLCDHAFLLSHGEMVYEGHPDHVVKYYNNMIALKDEEEMQSDADLARRSGNGKMFIQKITMLNCHGTQATQFTVGEKIQLVIDVEARVDLSNPTVGMSFHDRLGNEVFGINNHNLGIPFGDIKSGEKKRVVYEIDLRIGVNTYTVSASCHPEDTHLIENYDWINDAYVFRVLQSPDYIFVGASLLDTSVTIGDLP